MSSDQNMNSGQHVTQSQNDSQRPNGENWYPRSQPPFTPPNYMQFPVTGPYGDWPSVPSNIQFQQHPNPPTTFSMPTSFQNQPLYQQTNHAYPNYHNQQNSHPNHPSHTIPPPSVASVRGEKKKKGGAPKWTSEEDLQLCRAWVKVSEDPAIGVGQKGETFWSRVKTMFHNLMQEVYGKVSDRNLSGCQNRMSDIKGSCNKWSGIWKDAFQQPASGLSLSDSEAIARQMWEDDHNGKPFKHMACWEVLKECPRWKGINDSISQKSTDSTSQARGEPLVTPLPESAPIHTALNMDQSQTPISPILEEDSTGHTGGLTDKGATCTPILNGPASIDMQHPPGQKIARTGDVQKKQKLSVAQIAAGQTFRAGLASLQAATNARWEKSREDKRARDAKSDQVLQEEMRMQARLHDLELTRIRNDLMNRLTAAGEKLMAAVQKLEEFGHEPMLTPNQKFQYELRQEAVTIHRKQLAELKESLERTQVQSPLCMEPLSNSPTVGAFLRKRTMDHAVDEIIVEDD